MPFAPVSLVFDVMDTEGNELPEDVNPFPAFGSMDTTRIEAMESALTKANFKVAWLDQGDTKAGSIERVRSSDGVTKAEYLIKINNNHPPQTKFVTLTHELAHLFLGHLGEDLKLKIKSRTGLLYNQREIEAESVAYIVCGRHGVSPKSQSYLSNHVVSDMTTKNLDVYQIMKAAGQVESILKLTAKR